MDLTTILYISLFSDATIIFPFFVCIARWQTIHGLMKYIMAFVLVFVVRNAITAFIGEFYNYKLNNLFYYNLTNAVAFYLILAIDHQLVFTQSYRKLFKLFGILFGVCVVLDVFNGTLSDLNTGLWGIYTYPASVILIILVILLYFYDLVKGMRVFQITTYPFFWFNAGALVFYSGSSIIHILTSETFNQPPDIATNYWLLEAVLAIIFNCMIAISVLYSKNTTFIKVDSQQ